MIELVYPTNMDFLEPKSLIKEDMKLAKQSKDFSYEYLSLYASGEVYISAIIDTLTCQSYYNPHIITILKQLLSSGQNDTNFLKLMGICDEAELKQSNFWQIPVPEDYQNKTFGELFLYLSTQRGLISIGLYRLPGATDNDRPYVYTNPPEDAKLTPHDRVFVLGNTMPDDLKESTSAKVKKKMIEEDPGNFVFTNAEGGDQIKMINNDGGEHYEGEENLEKHTEVIERIESSKPSV